MVQKRTKHGNTPCDMGKRSHLPPPTRGSSHCALRWRCVAWLSVQEEQRVFSRGSANGQVKAHICEHSAGDCSQRYKHIVSSSSVSGNKRSCFLIEQSMAFGRTGGSREREGVVSCMVYPHLAIARRASQPWHEIYTWTHEVSCSTMGWMKCTPQRACRSPVLRPERQGTEGCNAVCFVPARLCLIPAWEHAAIDKVAAVAGI